MLFSKLCFYKTAHNHGRENVNMYIHKFKKWTLEYSSMVEYFLCIYESWGLVSSTVKTKKPKNPKPKILR